MKDLKDFCFLILIIFFLLFILTANGYTETIIWKFDDDPTIQKCMEESHQSKKICKKLIYLIDKSKKYDTIYIGGMFDEK